MCLSLLLWWWWWCRWRLKLHSLPSSSGQGAYYTQPVYAAQPHVIHHTTVVQPNSIPSTALYPAPVPVPTPRNNSIPAMGMVAGATMAMSAGRCSVTRLFWQQLWERTPISLWANWSWLITFCRDPADNTPAPPDWRTPGNSANLQAPGDTWLQLRTTSLVEPTHHVSICPPPLSLCFFLCAPRKKVFWSWISGF